MKNFEGKGQAKNIKCFLVYLAFKENEDIWAIDLFLTRIVKTVNYRNEGTGDWSAVAELLSVFARKELRVAYLQKRYTPGALQSLKKRGETLAKSVTIKLFNTQTIVQAKIKLRQDDKGHLSDPSTRRAPESLGELGGKYSMNQEKQTIEEMLMEIYQRSTENYLEWLKNYNLRKEGLESNSENQESQPTKEEKKDE